MEEAILKALMQYGPVGLIAAMALYMYRTDRKDTEKRMSEDRLASEKRYGDLVVGVSETVKDNTQSNKELTQVNTKLCTIIEYHASMNGNGRRPLDKQ